jgi:deoxyribonuclease V
MKWPKNIKEAGKIQHTLKQKVKLSQLIKKPEFITGVDAAFSGDKVIGAACLYKYPELTHIEDAYAVTKVLFPYIPGFLSFREGASIIKAVNKLKIKPDVVLFDGQGIAHPKGVGIATHIGVLLDIPSIGCAKSRLVGNYTEPGTLKGQYAYLKYHGRIVGAVLRTRDNVKPVFVSPGHMIDLKGAIDIVLRCTGKYRIPEPLRFADQLSKKLKKKEYQVE